MDVAVLAAYPATAHKLRSEAHEPCVGVAVCGTGLGTDLARKVISEAQTSAGTAVYYALQKHKHTVSALGIYHLVQTRLEIGYDIALIILDAAHEHRSRTYALIGECGVSAHHLSHRNLARTETESHRGHYLGVVNAKVVKHRNKLLRIELTHKVSRNPVVRLRQAPLQRNHLAVALAVGIARCPCLVAHSVRLLHVRSH